MNSEYDFLIVISPSITERECDGVCCHRTATHCPAPVDEVVPLGLGPRSSRSHGGDGASTEGLGEVGV